MEPEAFLNSLSPAYEYIYNNESELEQLQYPLALSRFKVPRFANALYTDNSSEYFTYSGVDNSLLLTKEKEGRYKNFSIRAYSGDSFNFYLQVGSGVVDSDVYLSGPLTISGVYSTLTQYTTKADALTNAITFTAPENNSTVYTIPSIQNLSWMRLYHQSVDSVTPYRLYQFLPRTLIQVDDLEADVIDAVTVRVSGSIVVTADNLAAGSITGDKIMAGTVSGVLITPGTVTANEIAGGTITANKLNVDKLSAITSNMGELYVTEKLEVTSGYLTAGIARVDNTGIKLGSINTALPASSALRIYGSGTVGNVVGMAFYNGDFSDSIPQSVIQLDSTNALEIESNQIDSVVNVNFTDDSTASSLNVYNGDIKILKSPDTPADVYPGALIGYDSDGTVLYELGPDGVFISDGTANVFSVSSMAGDVDASGYINSASTMTAQGNITTYSDVVALDAFSSLPTVTLKGASGNVETIGGVSAADTIQSDTGFTTTGTLQTQSIVDTTSFSLNTSTRSFSLATPKLVYAENINKPTLTITGSGTSGTSGSIILNNSSVVTPGQKQGYLNLDGNNTLEITNQVTNGQLHLNLPNNGTMRVYVNSPATEQFAINSTGATINGALNASGAIGFGASNNKLTVAAATGDTAIAGTLGVVGKVTNDNMGYATIRRTTTQSITTAGTTIIWNAYTRNNNITYSTDTITIANAGYYAFSATFATTDNLTSLRMTLSRGTINYVSTLHGAGLSTANGYMFNFNIMFWAGANTTYKVILTPSSNTTLNTNNEGFAGPSPIINIVQLIGV
jgi:hypothetical protein